MSPFLKYVRSKKVPLACFFLLLLLALISGILLYHPKSYFQEFTEQLFFDDITTDTISLHYTLAYPARYLQDSYPVTLPEYDKEALKKSRCRIENSLSVLNAMDPTKLLQEERYCHALLKDFLTIQKKGFPFTYLEEYFSPSSGIVANYPILMAEYTFRSRRDVTDYLTLLRDTPNYFSSFFSFQKERADKGYALASASLEKTLAQCDTILTKEALESNSHFLQITFRERLAYLVAKDILSKKEALQYLKENDALLKNVVLPAYEELKASLLSLQTDSLPLQGLYRSFRGKEYYQWYVQKQIGSSLSLSEILERLEKDYEENLMKFSVLRKKIASYPDYENYMDQEFPVTDSHQILTLLQEASQKDFPSLSDLSDRAVIATVKSVSDCMEEYTSPAFYLLPPMDDFWKNTIYINNSSTPEGLDLFTTLAHEGYPGHLNQTVYYQLYSQKQDTPLIRHILNYGGYVEGWAIYCEFYAYDYATQLYPESTREFYDLWHQLLVCDKKLQLALLSILDIKLHSCDDSMETAAEILKLYGITEEETIADIRQYILEEPGNYLKYYMGYLLLTDLKEEAGNRMGSDFTDYSFHEFILQAGPSDFDNLKKRLMEQFPLS